MTTQLTDRYESQRRYVAAQLALVALGHQDAAEQVPCLVENTAQALEKLLSAAETLGFGAEFRARCRGLDVELPVGSPVLSLTPGPWECRCPYCEHPLGEPELDYDQGGYSRAAWICPQCGAAEVHTRHPPTETESDDDTPKPDQVVHATAQGEHYRVVFEYACDGYRGKCALSDPSDRPLLWFSVLALMDEETNTWEEIGDGLTGVFASASKDNLEHLAARVLRAVETVVDLYGSPEHLCEALADAVYIGITQFELDLAVANVVRVHYDPRHILPIVEPASAAMRDVFASAMCAGSVVVAVPEKDETQAGLWIHYEGGLYSRPGGQSPSPAEREQYAKTAAGRAAQKYPTTAKLYLQSWEGLRTVGFVDTQTWAVRWL